MANEIFDIAGVDELYALEPSEFTEARNALATEVRKGGNREAAEAIKKLARPSVVAAALNRVARERPDAVGEVLTLGERVRAAQAKALEGGDPGGLREATAARRTVIRDLASAVADIAGENHRAQAADTLEAASMDEEASELLRTGRLSAALEPRAGFGLEDMPEPKEDSPAPKTDRRELQRLGHEVEAAESALRSADERVTRAEDRLAETKQILEQARTEAKQAKAAHTAAVAALEDAVD